MVLEKSSLVLRQLNRISVYNVRAFSVSGPTLDSSSSPTKDNYKLLIVGGGSGGITIAAKFKNLLGKSNVAVVDPSEWHYYQPGWTLVGGGLKTADEVRREQKSLIPDGVDWFKTTASSFDPANNSVTLKSGQKLNYDYLVMATGIETNFSQIKGLKEALANDDQVVSMYSHENVQRVFPAIKSFKGGNAIFTFPKVPIKCPGAPQKIMYLAEDYFRKNGLRDKATVIYNTTLPVIFGVKKYAASLMKIVEERNIQLNTKLNLTEIDYKNKVAVFENLDKPGETKQFNYSLLHVAPSMKPFDEVKSSPLADPTGYVDVDKHTLQHTKYPNVFGIGDCTNLPTSKTAAAIAGQSGVLARNLKSIMNGQPLEDKKYDGYTSCPLVTGYGKLILAEFDFNGNPLETFPFDQGNESRLMYHLKKDFMPELYWNSFLKGYWEGPAAIRQAFGKKQ